MNFYSLFIVAATSVGLLAEGKPAVSSLAKSNLPPSGLPKIIGGQDAIDGQFPYHLELEYFGSLGWKHSCGAVLLTPMYAMTGAKCVNNINVVNIRLWAGLFVREDYVLTNAQQLSVNNVKVHDDYNEFISGLPNDIAILTFAWAADLSRPNIDVALLPPDDTNEFTQAGCTIIGWGRFSEEQTFAWSLQYADINVISNSDCSTRMTGLDGKKIESTHICVESDPQAVVACSGDAGSPLLCGPSESETSPQYVVGITSWSVMNQSYCNAFYPSVYTRISKYLDWIAANTP